MSSTVIHAATAKYNIPADAFVDVPSDRPQTPVVSTHLRWGKDGTQPSVHTRFHEELGGVPMERETSGRSFRKPAPPITPSIYEGHVGKRRREESPPPPVPALPTLSYEVGVAAPATPSEVSVASAPASTVEERPRGVLRRFKGWLCGLFGR